MGYKSPEADRQYRYDSYHYARSLGLCGRCKKRDALPEMAYCSVCHAANRAHNHKRQGIPARTYQTKFTRTVNPE